ncbi:MAG: HAMP domain-containing sensor histidine kinase [Croceibacterium sp.]
MASLRSSAAYRIAFAYAAVFALGIALLGVAVFYAMHASFVRELDASLAEEASALQEEYRTGGDAELAEAIAKREAVDTRDLSGYGVFAASGERLYGNLGRIAPQLGFQDLSVKDRAGQPDTGRAIGIDLGHGKRLLVATDLEPVEQIDRTVITLFVAGFAGVVLLGLIAALVLGGYLRRRLETLRLSAETIIAGNISHRMPVSARDDEFDRLAGTLNTMLERIDQLLENLRQISGDVAHDLRTPLTRLRNQLDAGQSILEPATPSQTVIARAVAQVDEILALFAAILRISEIESGQIARRFEQVNLSELVGEIAESYAPAIEENGRTLLWQVEPGISARVDRDLIAQALVNLIENGQRHTPAGSKITVTLQRSDQAAVVQVADNGPGVPETEWPRIARRFVRLDRSRSTNGHGLGLNLVSAVAHLHRGELTFADNRPGLTVAIIFPAA